MNIELLGYEIKDSGKKIRYLGCITLAYDNRTKLSVTWQTSNYQAQFDKKRKFCLKIYLCT